MFGMGPMEMLIVGIIAVLLFGQRLPEVGRSLGKGLLEFKKGLKDIQEDMDKATNPQTAGRVTYRNSIDDYEEPTAPKFEPPAQEPQVAATAPTAAPEG